MRNKIKRYLLRKKRVRKKVFGTDARPRLSVYRSLKHIYAQIIDDETGKTLVAASTISPELKGSNPKNESQDGGKTALAKAVGKLLAREALEKGIKRVTFDRGGQLYHGRVKALAEGAREGGLEF